jgi:leucyl-tRNA synthetase
MVLPADSARVDIEKHALALPDILKWTDGQQIKKIIIIPDKMVNIVI